MAQEELQINAFEDTEPTVIYSLINGLEDSFCKGYKNSHISDRDDLVAWFNNYSCIIDAVEAIVENDYEWEKN